jgi:hypothetical protein
MRAGRRAPRPRREASSAAAAGAAIICPERACGSRLATRVSELGSGRRQLSLGSPFKPLAATLGPAVAFYDVAGRTSRRRCQCERELALVAGRRLAALVSAPGEIVARERATIKTTDTQAQKCDCLIRADSGERRLRASRGASANGQPINSAERTALSNWAGVASRRARPLPGIDPARAAANSEPN